MNEVTRAFIETALRKMLEQGHFSICTIDNILKLTGGVPNKDDYNHLHVLHCVSFSAMPREVREALPDIITRVINAEGMEVYFGPKSTHSEAKILAKDTPLRSMLPWHRRIF